MGKMHHVSQEQALDWKTLLGNPTSHETMKRKTSAKVSTRGMRSNQGVNPSQDRKKPTHLPEGGSWPTHGKVTTSLSGDGHMWSKYV